MDNSMTYIPVRVIGWRPISENKDYQVTEFCNNFGVRYGKVVGGIKVQDDGSLITVMEREAAEIAHAKFPQYFVALGNNKVYGRMGRPRPVDPFAQKPKGPSV